MDMRIERIFQEEMKGDKSFNEKDDFLSLLFGRSNHEMKEIWDRGIKHGIEIGLHKASLEGQKIELNKNTSCEKQKEFINKFYKLSEEYKCAIQYHPLDGMVIVDLDLN